MIVIEILSPSDSFMELEQKCIEYSAMGIRNVWVINPARRIGRVWSEGAWTETTRFAVEDSPIHLDVKWLFEQMDSYDDPVE
jgi:Uma2 family endonuclease